MKSGFLFITVLLSGLFLGGCTYYQEEIAPQMAELQKKHAAADKNRSQLKEAMNQITTLKRSLPPFEKVYIDTPLNVRIERSHAFKHELEITGPRQTLSNLILSVRGSTLQIHQTVAAPQSQKLATLTLRIPELRELHVISPGYVRGYDIQSSELDVYIQGSGSVNLSGQNINLQRLTSKDAGDIQISGINSNNVTIDSSNTRAICLNGHVGLRQIIAGNNTQRITVPSIDYSHRIDIVSHSTGTFYLSGKVPFLSAELGGSSLLDARNLRVRKAFINTADHAEADVFVTESLNAFATGTSDIYYYVHPKLIGQYMRDNGSILYRGARLRACTTPICPPRPRLPG
jgi:hypothetical protein